MPTYSLLPCLLCGSPGEELATAEELKVEVEQLWEFHGRRLRPETPPRHLADRLAFSQRPPLRLAWCAACELAWRNPAERASDVEETYEEETPARAVLGALHEAQRSAYEAQARRLTHVAGQPGSVLEIGSYVGGFLAAARARGWMVQGVDVNAAASAYARSLGLVVTIGDITATNGARRWDAVAVWNCLDQLADPRGTLREATRRLRTGGLLAIRVPNGGLYAAQRRAATASGPRAALARATLAQNNLLGFPYRWGFTPRALALLLEPLGLRVERVVGDVLVPLSDDWTRRWARVEERWAKRAMRLAARARLERAPWFEVYARKG